VRLLVQGAITIAADVQPLDLARDVEQALGSEEVAVALASRAADDAQLLVER
jgi:hypothetical protein